MGDLIVVCECFYTCGAGVGDVCPVLPLEKGGLRSCVLWRGNVTGVLQHGASLAPEYDNLCNQSGWTGSPYLYCRASQLAALSRSPLPADFEPANDHTSLCHFFVFCASFLSYPSVLGMDTVCTPSINQSINQSIDPSVRKCLQMVR